MQLAPMSNRRRPQQFSPGKSHYQMQKIFNFLIENFSEPAVSSVPTRQMSVQLKRCVFFYLPSTGELSVAHNREGGRFCTV